MSIRLLQGEATVSKKLEGKIALITGGSRGIGAAIAKRMAADGADVAITYTKGADAAASVVKEIERAGRKAIAIQADATDRSEEHTSELQSRENLVCRLLLEKKKKKKNRPYYLKKKKKKKIQ